ncbi:hypothetical protein C2G38_2206990 [Gigaspora rosea]|uniref:TLDc domain-containing protein n=1 Tax=Gigaspora rosea TaxID=44941 RepID=A0A397UKV0_9GLOM|nr:hypothetical protein C2G38_2206990 [Gigaspora rosea]
MPTEPFSNVINQEHEYEMASWIDNKPELYEFKLLLRGSRDRFTRDTFWNLCDKQKNLVIVIKVKDTNEILGRYYPIRLEKSFNGYKSYKESFIFSLKNCIVQTSILKITESVIHYFDNSGLSFTGGLVTYYSYQDDIFYLYKGTVYYENQLERNLLMFLRVHSFL